MRVIAGDGHGDDRFDSDGALLRLVHAISTSASVADVLRIAVDGIAPLFDSTCAAVTLATGDGSLEIAACSGEHDDYAAAVNSLRLPLSADSLAADAVLTGSYVVEREPFPTEQRALIEHFPGRAAVRAAAAVPIHSADGTVGIFLILSDRDTAFGSRRMESMRTFASIVALEIRRRRRIEGLVSERADAAALLDTAKALAAHTDERELVEHIARYGRAASHASFAIAWTLRGNLFEAVAVDGDDAGFAQAAKFNADATMPLGQGPEGRASRTQRIEIVKDAQADRAYAPWLEPARHSRVRSILALPLSDGERGAVVIGLYAPDVDAFDDHTIAHLRAYAEHGRIALETTRAFARSASAARERSLQMSASLDVTRSLDMGEVARSIARVTGETAGADFAVTYSGDRDVLSIAGTWNAPSNLAVSASVNVTDPAMATYPPVHAVRERRIAVYEDVTTDPQWLRHGWDQQATTHGFNSVVAVPLLNGKHPGAVVLFFAGKPNIAEPEIAALGRLGAEGGAAIEAARRYDRARAGRDFLNRVLEESTDAIVQIDLRGVVVGWNTGAERMYGFSRDEAVGTTFADMPIVPPESREDVRELFSRVARGEHVRAVEIVCKSRAGDPIEMLVSATPSRDEEGNIVGLVAFSKDITEQKKQFGQLQDQNRRLGTIREITRAFGREVGLHAVAQKGLEKLLETQHLDAGRIYVLDPAESRLTNVAQRGFTVEGTAPIDVQATTGAEGLLSSSVYYRQAMVLNDVEGQRIEHPYFSERSETAVSSVLTKPLAIGDQIVGAIQVIGFDGRRLSFDDQNLFHAIADELAASMRAAQLLEEASRMAITDPLTGLYNYRFTHDFLKKRLSEARRRRRPFSVIMADVDGLQAINERYGRAAGDDVLKQFGLTLASCVRLSDVVARYGGDEFIVLLPETQLGDALMLAERMTQAFAGHEWEKPVEDLEVTASMGCASFPESGSHTQMLLKAADAALFQAKKSGKNAIFPRTDTMPKFAG